MINLAKFCIFDPSNSMVTVQCVFVQQKIPRGKLLFQPLRNEVKLSAVQSAKIKHLAMSHPLCAEA